MNPHWHIIIISKAIVGVAYAISFHKCIMTYINHYRYLFWIFIYLALGLSCPTACGILVPWPWISPATPSLEGRFLTTGPPGKSPIITASYTVVKNPLWKKVWGILRKTWSSIWIVTTRHDLRNGCRKSQKEFMNIMSLSCFLKIIRYFEECVL